MLRGFTDSAGHEWRVWEVFPARAELTKSKADAHSSSSLKGTAYAEGWLCFESGEHKRRLAPIPADWHFRDKDLLEQLCSTATPVPLRSNARISGPRTA
jgi:hypothetical protein